MSNHAVRACACKAFSEIWSCVSPADEADCAHARGARAQNARNGILNHERSRRRDLHHARRQQEEIRRRLAARDLHGAEAMREISIEGSDRQREIDSLRPRRGSNATGLVQCVERRCDSVDCAQILPEARKQTLVLLNALGGIAAGASASVLRSNSYGSIATVI